MDWEIIVAVAELVGAIGVILTLLYLARQIGQTNQIARASVVRELQQRYHELYQLVASDVGMAELTAKLTDVAYRAESDIEQQRLENLAQMIAGMYFSAQSAYDQGQMDDNVYSIYREDVEARLVQWPAIKFYLEKVIKRWPTGAKLDILEPIWQ